VILVDTSALIEFLRDTGSATCERVTELLAAQIAVCDAIRMEVLAGARSERHVLDLRRLLARATVLPTRPIHYEHAANLYRQCRQRGATVRKLKYLAECMFVSADKDQLEKVVQTATASDSALGDAAVDYLDFDIG